MLSSFLVKNSIKKVKFQIFPSGQQFGQAVLGSLSGPWVLQCAWSSPRGYMCFTYTNHTCPHWVALFIRVVLTQQCVASMATDWAQHSATLEGGVWFSLVSGSKSCGMKRVMRGSFSSPVSAAHPGAA